MADNGSLTTYESVKAVTLLLAQRHKHTCVAVSDGFHLYRIKLMFRSLGITAYASPAPDSPIEADSYLSTLYSLREMAYTSLWYIGIRNSRCRLDFSPPAECAAGALECGSLLPLSLSELARGQSW